MDFLSNLRRKAGLLTPVAEFFLRKGFDPSEPRDERGRWTEGGGVHGAEPKVDFYHGTLSSYVNSIIAEGLVVKPKRNFAGVDETLYTGERGESVYVTSSEQTARDYARTVWAFKDGKGDIAVLHFKVPKTVADSFKRDEQADENDSYRTPHKLSSEYLASYDLYRPAWGEPLSKPTEHHELRKAVEELVDLYVVVFASEKEAKGFDPSEPRDSHGRWTTGGGSHTAPEEPVVGVGAPPKRSDEYYATWAQTKKLMQDAGIMVVSAEGLGSHMKERLKNFGLQRHPQHLTKMQRAATEGMIDAMEVVKGSPGLQYLMRRTQFCLAYCSNSDAMAYAISANDLRERSIVLFPLNAPMGNLARGANYTVSEVLADRAVARGASVFESVREQYKAITLHELGHIADHYSGGKLKQLVAGDVVRAESTYPQVATWVEGSRILTKGISRYAGHSAVEAAAESFSLVASGSTLPKELHFTESAVKNFLAGHGMEIPTGTQKVKELLTASSFEDWLNGDSDDWINYDESNVGDEKKGFDPSEPRDEHGQWTTGGGSTPAGGDAQIDFYHGTIARAVDSIAREGLTVSPARRNFVGEGYVRENFYMGDRGESVFVTIDRKSAETYARQIGRHLEGKKAELAILHFKVPKSVAASFKVDELDSNRDDPVTSYQVPKKLDAQYLHAYDTFRIATEGRVVGRTHHQLKAQETLEALYVVIVADGDEGKGFDPSEPRDDHGRWVSGGTSGGETSVSAPGSWGTGAAKDSPALKNALDTTSTSFLSGGFFLKTDQQAYFKEKGFTDDEFDQFTSLLEGHTKDARQKDSDAKIQEALNAKSGRLYEFIQARADAEESLIDRVDKIWPAKLAAEREAKWNEFKRDVAHKLEPYMPEYDGTMEQAFEHRYGGSQYTYHPFSEMKVYRKGEFDKTILSTTTNSAGAATNWLTGENHRIKPTNSRTVGELRSQGYRPTAGLTSVYGYIGEDEVLFLKMGRSMRKGVVYLDKGYDPSEPRDSHGRWTAGGSSHADDLEPSTLLLEGPKAPKEVAHSISEAHAILLNHGWQVSPVDSLPGRLKRELQVREASSLDDMQMAAIEGVASSMETLKKSTYLAHIATDVEIVLASYQPSEAAMTAVTGDGKVRLFFNTGHPPIVAGEEKPWAVASLLSQKLVKEGLSQREATKEEFRVSVLHEFGHFVDRATGGGLTHMVVGTLIMSGLKPEKIQPWLAKNISGYSATSPKETAAEIFSLVADGKKLPKHLAPAERIIREIFV